MSARPEPLQTKVPPDSKRAEAFSRSKRPGYFEHQHDWVDQIVWIARKSGAHAYVLLKILSLQNQRNALLEYEGRKQTGCTGLVEIKDLAWPEDADKLPRHIERLSPWQARTFQLAFNDLCGENGPLERWTREQAIEAGLITKAEAGRPRDAYVFRARTDRWKEIAADNLAAEAEDLRAESDDEPEETDAAEPEIVPVTDQPLILMPGQKARPMTLSDALYKRWSRCKTIEIDFEASVPLAQRFTIAGDVIRCSIADYHQQESTKSETQTKPISLSTSVPDKPAKVVRRTKGETQTKPISLGVLPGLAEFLEPIFSQQFGAPPDPGLLSQIATALEGCPLEDLDRACYGRTVRSTLSEFARKRKPVETGLFLWMAERSAAAWKAEQGTSKPKPAPQSPARMTRAQRVEALAISMQWLAGFPDHPESPDVRRTIEATRANDPELYREAVAAAAQAR